MKNLHKLKELHEKLKKWCEDNGDEELGALLEELKAAFAPADDGEGDGSNPPGGPGTPP